MEARSITAERWYARRKIIPALFLLASLLVFSSSLEVFAVNVKLAWDASPEPLVTGYKLYYGTSSGNYTTVVDAGNRTDYTLTGLAEGTTYYFAATAYTGTGDESTFSNVTSCNTSGSVPAPSGDSGGGVGCFIASAAYGGRLAPEVVELREFRDRYLLTNQAGQAVVEWYYRVSPPVAAFIAKHESLKTAVRWGLTPIVGAVKYPVAALVMILLIPVAVTVRKRLRGSDR